MARNKKVKPGEIITPGPVEQPNPLAADGGTADSTPEATPVEPVLETETITTNDQGEFVPAATFEVTEKRRRGRKPKAEQAEVGIGTDTGKLLIAVIETLGMTIAGPDAAFNDTERMLLDSSVPHIIESVSPQVVERVTNIMYPAMAGTALVLYVTRVMSLKRVRQPVVPAAQSMQAAQQESATFSPNGAYESDQPAVLDKTWISRNVRDF